MPLFVDGQIPRGRLFVQSEDPCTMFIPFPDLIVYNEEKQVSQLQMKGHGNSKPHP